MSTLVFTINLSEAHRAVCRKHGGLYGCAGWFVGVLFDFEEVAVERDCANPQVNLQNCERNKDE